MSKMTRADLEDLIQWLETKTGTYDPGSPWNCLLAQYLRARGHQEVDVMNTIFSTKYVHGHPIPQLANDIAGVKALKGESETFEAALQRATTALYTFEDG